MFAIQITVVKSGGRIIVLITTLMLMILILDKYESDYTAKGFIVLLTVMQQTPVSVDELELAH